MRQHAQEQTHARADVAVEPELPWWAVETFLIITIVRVSRLAIGVKSASRSRGFSF